MKYRTKLYLALVGIAICSSTLALGILLYDIKGLVLMVERTKAITVAATTAALINGNDVAKINSRADEDSHAYQTIKEQLIRARDANRRNHIYIKYLYLIRPTPGNKRLVFIADAESEPDLMSHPGDENKNIFVPEIIQHINDYYSPGKFINDQWGVWFSGFAPVYDSEDNYVGTIGADIAMTRIVKDSQRVIPYFLFSFAISVFLGFLGAHVLSKRVTSSLRCIHECVQEIGKGKLDAKATLDTHDEFEDLAVEINKMTQGLRERERLKLNFARYVSQHILEKILKSESPTRLEGERRKITVLFSDIRQFTHLAEHLSPESVVSLLNEYFGVMLDVIFAHQGTLDKFIGDGIMVEFGAPLDDAHQEKNAINAALDMQKALLKLTDKWEKEGRPKIEMGVGIHTGFAVVGNIGSEKRLEYTAIGDTVNVASRLEQATKVINKKILLSESTYEAIKDQFKFQSLGPMILPGRKEPIVVYSVEDDGK